MDTEARLNLIRIADLANKHPLFAKSIKVDATIKNPERKD